MEISVFFSNFWFY